jgi:hypothetical protein
MLEQTDNADRYMQISLIERMLVRESNPDLYTHVHNMIFGEDEHTIDEIFEAIKNKKKTC